MDEDKFKYKITYFVRKKVCPFCGNQFVYFCLRCVFVLVSYGHRAFLKKVYISRRIYFKRCTIPNEYLQQMFQFLVLLYLYKRIYRILNFLEPVFNEYKYMCIKYELEFEAFCYVSLRSVTKKPLRGTLQRTSKKEPQKKFKTDIQEISRKSVTSVQSGNPNIASTVASTSSIKSKRSSNLLSAFVRRTKKRKPKNSDPVPKTASISTQKLSFTYSNSTLGVHTEEEIDINIENYDKKVPPSEKLPSMKKNEETLNTTDSNHSVLSAGKMKRQFFRFIKKHPSEESEKKQPLHGLAVQTSNANVLETNKSFNICQSTSCRRLSLEEKGVPDSDSCVPTSFVNFGKSALNVTLSDGLQSVQELASRCRESESHLIQVLCRYVKDPSLQKELLDGLSQHSRLQWDTERRASALANDMWTHQMEIGRVQERTLQETLNSLVKQNRQLQIDNEVMFRKQEKLVRRLRSFPEMSLKYKCVDCETQIEHVLKHNENLQTKLDAYIKQMEHLENELHSLKKHNDSLEEQLRSTASQTYSIAATYERNKSNYEIELIELKHKLQLCEEATKRGLEAGDLLVEDLDRVKRQFSRLPFTMDWTKFKSEENCLNNLLNMSRSCINDLCKELLSMEAQMSIKDKEIEALQGTNSKLQENLKKSTTELDKLSKKLDEKNNDIDPKRTISEENYKLVEASLKYVEERLEKLTLEHEQEKIILRENKTYYENIQKELTEEKDKMIEHTKIYISNIKSENEALRTQVEGLNRLLSEAGAGDFANELAKCREQITYYQAQYYELLNENQRYLDEIEMLKQEKTQIIDQQEKKYRNLQVQEQNLEKLNKQNSSLKQLIESERQTVLSLQNERKKYLEEKSMLRTIFQHMKTEISRVQKLETAVADISKEASKLALVAEYNKQVGEKLKGEVLEKDQTILQLRSSVEKLNDVQVQNAKEKLSLCYELSEVCQMKDKLNSILTLEVQKNMALDDSKRELLESASTQLKKYEEMHKNGRSAVKELVRDYKVIVDQRDSLLKDKEKLMKELSELRTLYHEELKKCDSVACIKNEKENRIAELVARQEEDKKVINDLKSKINEEISKYDNNMTQLEKLIRQLRKDKEHQEGSVKYLQNNIQKLHNDLNESRKNEKESKDLLNKCLLEKATLENERHQLERNYTAINQDKDKLVKEISYLNGLCEKVLSDFEASIKSSVEKEELFKNEINESKSMLLERGREIDRLNKIIQSKQVETEKILEQYATLKKNERELRDQLKLFENQTLESKELRSQNQVLEENLTKAEIEYNSCICQLENAKKEVDSLQKQLRIVEDHREKDYSFYKTHVDELVRKNDELQVKSKKEFSEFKMNLNDMVQKLNNERSAYATLSEIHKDISAKYLKSIKDAVDERNARQEMEGKLRGAIRASEQLQSEKADLQQQIDVLLDGLNDGKSRINILTQEKDNAQKCSDDLQKRYNDLLTKCLSLENQLRTASLKTDSSTDTDGKFQEQIDRFKNEFEENHELILTLKDNIGKLQHHVTGLEFQKSEMTLRLHETQRKLETEQGLSEQLKNTHKLILAAILKMKDDGKVDPHDVRHLLHMVRNIDDDPTNDDLNECN